MPSDDPAIEAVRNCIRTLLGERGWTYRDLASALGVSEVTVKRWMTSEDLSMGRIRAVAEALGTSTFALLRQAEFGQEQTFEVSEAIEAALVSDPDAHRVWDALRAGRRPEAVRAHYGHEEGAWFRLLGRLERLGLLERHPEGRVRLHHHGIHNWRHGGPLQERYRAQLTDWVVESWTQGGVVQSATRIVGADFFEAAELELRALARTWRDRAWRDQQTCAPERQRRARWILVLQEAPAWPELPG